jgi:iduronate 2-sulfatase
MINFKTKGIGTKEQRWSSIYFWILCVSILINSNSVFAQKPNVLLICVDDLRPELKSFGADHIISPNIDRLAQEGMSFYKHFVNAPSCGPSRYTLLTGTYGPASNSALFTRAQKMQEEGAEVINPSMPEWFKTHGYTTISIGKVSHHPGGRGGKDWDDNSIIEMPNAWDKHMVPVGDWKHPRGIMHGLAHGEIRKKASEMDVFQNIEGDDTIYPDGLIAEEAIKELREVSINKEKPFFLAVGIIKPHLPFGAPKSYYDLYEGVEFPSVKHPNKPEGTTTWHKSGEFMNYNRWGKDTNTDSTFADEVRRHYAACVSYADAQVGKILAELKQTGADENTIVILWGDHGWHLGEHAVWGKHTLFEESLHSPLIIRYPNMKTKNATTNGVVETLDIFPTLCDLAGIDTPKFTQGTSLVNLLEDSTKKGHSAIAYHKNYKISTIRTSTHRMILHENDFVELYDHTSEEKETKNLADQYPELVEELKKELKSKLESN